MVPMAISSRKVRKLSVVRSYPDSASGRLISSHYSRVSSSRSVEASSYPFSRSAFSRAMGTSVCAQGAHADLISALHAGALFCGGHMRSAFSKAQTTASPADQRKLFDIFLRNRAGGDEPLF